MLVAWEWDARGIIAELFNLIVLNLAAPSLPQVSPECVCRCYAFAKHMDDSHIDGSRLARVRRSGLVSYCHIFIRRRDVSRMAFEAAACDSSSANRRSSFLSALDPGIVSDVDFLIFSNHQKYILLETSMVSCHFL
jgi:hypothetical protein